ncbi:AlpA family phage regulatory protein [Hoeflea sp. AS60]|uniref:helix-turn-helix transcriptional regulator n=1 Tax=Hoeflea sp. AS60 TaxID=3135780 RepID=UPI0031772CC6
MTALLSLKQVMERIPLSKSEIYRRIRDRRFPQPVRIGVHRIGFSEAEIEQWLTDRLDERRHAPKAEE